MSDLNLKVQQLLQHSQGDDYINPNRLSSTSGNRLLSRADTTLKELPLVIDNNLPTKTWVNNIPSLLKNTYIVALLAGLIVMVILITIKPPFVLKKETDSNIKDLKQKQKLYQSHIAPQKILFFGAWTAAGVIIWPLILPLFQKK